MNVVKYHYSYYCKVYTERNKGRKMAGERSGLFVECIGRSGKMEVVGVSDDVGRTSDVAFTTW